MHIIYIICIIYKNLNSFPRYGVISYTHWWEAEGSMGGLTPWITARSIRETLASWAITPFSLCCLTNSLGFCLNITHIALKASIFRNYPQIEVTLMCTERFLMIRYKTNGILCALTSPVHCCAWITSYMFYNSYCNYLIVLIKQTSRQIYTLFSIALHWFLGLSVSTPVSGRVDLSSSPKGESNITRQNIQRYFVNSFVLYALYILYSLFAGRCSPTNIGTARIGPTQGAFWSVQLSGDRTHQVQGCAASILQSVSCKTVPWQSPIRPRHDKAAGYRQWGFRCLARFSLVCSCIASVLRYCYDGHWLQVLWVCPCLDLGNLRWSW